MVDGSYWFLVLGKREARNIGVVSGFWVERNGQWWLKKTLSVVLWLIGSFSFFF